MNRSFYVVSQFASVFILAFATSLIASNVMGTLQPAYAKTEAQEIVHEARAWALMDEHQNVIASSSEDSQLPPASITKVMTAVVALDSGKSLDEVCTYAPQEFEDGAQLAGYTADDRPTLRELLEVALVYSANDACVAIAQNIAGSEQAFVERMNAKAQELGLSNTHFVNVSGLEADGHYASARDLCKLGAYALQNYPFIARTVRLPQVQYVVNGTNTTYKSTDHLIGKAPGFVGIKTGAVESGYTFLGCVKYADFTFYLCVLGCSTSHGRFADAQRLGLWAYQEYLGHLGTRPIAVRYLTNAYDFTSKMALVSTSIGSQAIYFDPTQQVSYKTYLPNSGLYPYKTTCGYTTYTQNGRARGLMGASTSVTRCKISLFNIFSLPLFYTLEELGL